MTSGPQINVPILRIPFAPEDLDFVTGKMREVLLSGHLTQGRWTEQFEAEFARFAGSRYAVAVNSGTAALEVILRALQISDGSLIVPTNTFLATALAAIHAGNRVIFADCDPETLALDVDDVKTRLAPDTRAVIVVHIGGIVTPRIDELKRLCDERGMALIEDCAHAHGCAIDGRSAGTIGVAGAFSFFPTKVLTVGEGGVITTNDEALYRRARMVRNQGKNPDLGNQISEIGHNFRLSEITAVLGLQQMRRAEAVIEDRRRVARFYDQALVDVPGLRPVRIPPTVRCSYYKYIAYLDEGIDRAELKRRLKSDYGVSLTGEVYASLCHEEPVWETHTYCGQSRERAKACAMWPSCGCQDRGHAYPGAERIARRHVCLPLYPGLTSTELEHTVQSLRDLLASPPLRRRD